MTIWSLICEAPRRRDGNRRRRNKQEKEQAEKKQAEKKQEKKREQKKQTEKKTGEETGAEENRGGKKRRSNDRRRNGISPADVIGVNAYAPFSAYGGVLRVVLCCRAGFRFVCESTITP